MSDPRELLRECRMYFPLRQPPDWAITEWPKWKLAKRIDAFLAQPVGVSDEPVAWRHSTPSGWVVTKTKHMDSEPLYPLRSTDRAVWADDELTNEELRDAIQAAKNLIGMICPPEAHYKASVEHYKALLKEQERRALAGGRGEG